MARVGPSQVVESLGNTVFELALVVDSPRCLERAAGREPLHGLCTRKRGTASLRKPPCVRLSSQALERFACSKLQNTPHTKETALAHDDARTWT